MRASYNLVIAVDSYKEYGRLAKWISENRQPHWGCQANREGCWVEIFDIESPEEFRITGKISKL